MGIHPALLSRSKKELKPLNQNQIQYGNDEEFFWIDHNDCYLKQ
jgi:hypothetical protein